MKKLLVAAAAGLFLMTLAAAGRDDAEPASGMERGTPEIQSMSALAFGPDGTLFIGDSKGGAVFAVDTQDRETREPQALSIADVETRLAQLLGTEAAEVMIHDLAVSPVSNQIYLAVSRGRSGWANRWELPNHVADADILLRVAPDGAIEEVPLNDVPFARAALANPIAADKKHPWQENVLLRSDTITDMALGGGTLFVAGLSNEEFASTMWRLPVPFGDGATATTLEIFHGAHGAYETHAPIRTFLPYEIGGEEKILAAYLCTPFVTFDVDDLKDGSHLKGRTIGEFGAGNYPLDMVLVKRSDKEQILIANSNLPLMLVDTEAIASFEGEITEEVEGYLAGVPFEIRSGTGMQQMDVLAESHLVTLQRMPGGTLALQAQALRR